MTNPFMNISRNLSSYLLLLIVMLSGACSTTKFVNNGEYLLDKVTIKPDNKDIPVSELKGYLRQTPNTNVLGLFRMQLGIYNFSPKDTTRRWNRFWSRTFKSWGEPPVIYDNLLTQMSAQQLQRLYQNRGYINAKVDTSLIIKAKKIKVVYKIRSNKPYSLRNYKIVSNHPVFDSIA